MFNTDSTLTLWQSKVGEFMVNFACKDEALAGKRGLATPLELLEEDMRSMWWPLASKCLVTHRGEGIKVYRG